VASPTQLGQTREPWGADAAAAPRSRRPAWGPVALALVLASTAALAYLIASPPAADLAAASYRADVFSRLGFALWDNGWYGGHSLLGYSVLAPALSAITGVRVLLALSTVLAAGLFAAIVDRAFGRPAAYAAAAFFVLGLAGEMLSGRVPYDLGVAIALASLLALQRGHVSLALLAALAASLASPVAGAFLALSGLALTVAEGLPRHRTAPARDALQRRGLWLAGSALVPIALLVLAFPEGGYEPFAAEAFWPAFVGVVVIAAALPRRWRALRIGAALYAFALALAYLVQTPVGGNAARLGALLAAPLVVGVLWGRRPVLLALVVPALIYWQLATPLDDLVKVLGDPSIKASYYAPLRAELEWLTRGVPTRIEVPMTGAHAESQLLTAAAGGRGADGLSLARGWERQLDTRYAALFYRPRLSAHAYRAWLLQNAVAFVALPDVRLDESSSREAALIRGGVPYLQEVWHSAHWRLFAVRHAQPLTTPPARLAALGAQSFLLDTPSPGAYEVRVRFSPYWALLAGHGCVREAPSAWTVVDARSSGKVRVGIAFSPGRVIDHGARCR
jgi:hypothetical protein